MGGRCVACTRPMAEVSVRVEGKDVAVDACDRCLMVWFDPREEEALPHRLPPALPIKEALSPEATEAVARMRLAHAGVVHPEDPDQTDTRTGLLALLFGLPVLRRIPQPVGRPWLTWALCLTIVGLYAAASIGGWDKPEPREWWRELAEGKKAVPENPWAEKWGFVPADPWRNGGFSWVTSFFVHGSWWHVFGNLYFLLLVGAGAEAVLGRVRLAGLLLSGMALSCALDWASDPHRTIPAIGASGGIAALFGWFALALPQVRIHIALFGRHDYMSPPITWLAFPVRFVFAVWFLYQVLLVDSQRLQHVAYAAHIGGALAGVLFWAVGRARARDPRDGRQDLAGA